MAIIKNPLTIIQSSAPQPSTSTGGLFTGATIPLTYKDNTHDYENNYVYKSSNYNITITGLDSEATITGNGTKEVHVNFDVTSATTSLTAFTITLSDGTNTYTYNGLHAHYGSTVTGILTFAYTNVPPTGTGTIGTEYKFITSNDLPLFANETTLWNTIYSYQVLNILIGNYSGTSIGDWFLGFGYSFNQPLIVPNGVTTIGNYFLDHDIAFNQPLTIPNSVTSIGDDFLHQCQSFNQPLSIPSNITSISYGFLRTCVSFNQPLIIPNGVTTIGDNVISANYSFNQPLTIPNSVTSIGDNFLNECRSLNQPLILSSNLTTIGDYFLMRGYSFNQPLTIPSSLTTIGNNFLFQAYAFNQPLTIPSSLTSIGTKFLNNCYSLSTIIYESAVYPTDSNSLAQDTNSKTSTDGAGIKVYGTNRAGLITALPDRTSSPYRKLIDGGA